MCHGPPSRYIDITHPTLKNLGCINPSPIIWKQWELIDPTYECSKLCQIWAASSSGSIYGEGPTKWRQRMDSKCQMSWEKKNFYFPLYWLFNRDPYTGLS